MWTPGPLCTEEEHLVSYTKRSRAREKWSEEENPVRGELSLRGRGKNSRGGRSEGGGSAASKRKGSGALKIARRVLRNEKFLRVQRGKKRLPFFFWGRGSSSFSRE